jgi:hypothetical protein
MQASSRIRSGAVAALVVAGSLLAFSAAGAQANKAPVKQAGAAKMPANLASVKASLDKYKDPIAAVRDGFYSSVACIDFPTGANDGGVTYKPGAMGVHFINMGNVGDKLDPAKPQVLIYKPVGDKLQLAAAEWFMPAAMVKDPAKKPRIFEQEMQGPMPGHTPIMPAELKHYDLHVWLWEENPGGVFEPTNANVKCPQGGYSHFEGAKLGH